VAIRSAVTEAGISWVEDECNVGGKAIEEPLYRGRQ
jgi:hypothetical protein